MTRTINADELLEWLKEEHAIHVNHAKTASITGVKHLERKARYTAQGITLVINHINQQLEQDKEDMMDNILLEQQLAEQEKEDG